MADFDLIPASNGSAWLKGLQLCGNHDVYHLPQYHLLAERLGEGKPFLFLYQNNGIYAALPILLRPVAEVEGLQGCRFNDITSVYGYPGVVTSLKEGAANADEFRSGFQNSLRLLFEQLSAVTFFTRTNPLVPSTWLFKGMAEILPLSATVAIDLSASNEAQLNGMTKGHRYDIRKALRLGVRVIEDSSFDNIDDFIEIYNETMRRNGAREDYYFPRDYYLRLKSSFGESIRLYFAKFGEDVISAALIFIEDHIIQYHLSGTPAELLPLHGAKVILNEVRCWGTQNGYSWLHLGGGVGSSEDSLFRFKAGFSKLRLPFEIVRMIINKETYEKLVATRHSWLSEAGHVLPESNYFPEYRKPYHKIS